MRHTSITDLNKHNQISQQLPAITSSALSTRANSVVDTSEIEEHEHTVCPSMCPESRELKRVQINSTVSDACQRTSYLKAHEHFRTSLTFAILLRIESPLSS